MRGKSPVHVSVKRSFGVRTSSELVTSKTGREVSPENTVSMMKFRVVTRPVLYGTSHIWRILSGARVHCSRDAKCSVCSTFFFCITDTQSDPNPTSIHIQIDSLSLFSMASHTFLPLFEVVRLLPSKGDKIY